MLAVLTLSAGLAAEEAKAQARESVSVNQYRPAPLSSDGFVIAGPEVPPHLTPDAQLHVEYSNDPLVFEGTPGSADTEQRALVSDQLTAHLVAALGLFDRLAVFGTMPVHLVLRGERLGEQPSATGAGLGDASLGGRVRITDAGAPLAAAVELGVTASTGRIPAEHAGVAGESGATVSPRLVLQWTAGPLRLMGNAGMRLRRDKVIVGLRYSDDLTYGLGAQMTLIPDRLDAQLELFGASPTEDLGDRARTPLELLAGCRLGLPFGLSASLGGGLGLLRGVGAPDARFALRVGYRPPPAPAPVSEARAAPTTVTPDETAPEGGDGGALHGVEVSTTDQDTVDLVDTGAVAGDSPAAEPPPMVAPAGVDSAYRDTDGDGMLDLDDTCPALPGPQGLGGCPKTLRLKAETGAVRLLRGIDFHRRRATLRTRSRKSLQDLRSLLAARPEVHLRLLVHIAPNSRARDPRALGEARGETLRAWGNTLPEGTRLEVMNCGSDRPPQHQDRRGLDGQVEAFIVSPLPPEGMPSSLHCAPVTAARERQR